MKIRFVIFDFDGVFTDGKISIDHYGDILKSYNVKDGMGISLLKQNNIEIGVISGYTPNKSQQKIIDHMGINYVSLGTKDKLLVLEEWSSKMGVNIGTEVAYMGDDINDLTVLHEVALAGCPSDAVDDVRQSVNFIAHKKGGHGCVREFCEYIINPEKPRTVTTMSLPAHPSHPLLNEIYNEFMYQIENFDMVGIHDLSQKIRNAKSIYTTGIGKSSNIAKNLSDILKSISYHAFYLDAINSLHGDIGTIKEGDVIIMLSNSGNTDELVRLVHVIRNKCENVEIVGIFCNKDSVLSSMCDSVYYSPLMNELGGNLDKIPSNSIMSHTIFTNILISLLKENVCIEVYKMNHPGGDIGKKL